MLTRVMLRRPLLATTETSRLSAVVLLMSMVMAVVVGGGGCFPALRRQPLEQRTAQGPTAREMFNFRVQFENGREPTFEEKRLWDNQIEEQISAYLRKNEDKANALDVSQFRYYRQATVGMDKDQILILLGPPVAVTGDQAEIAKIARRYWSQIEGNATEVWVYPNGWNLYFAGPKLVDITQYLPPG
jgi:hypothetical protein